MKPLTQREEGLIRNTFLDLTQTMEFLKNPLLFRRDGRSIDSLLPAERIQLLWRHATLCRDSLGESLGFTVIKKYLKIYVNHFKHAAQLRDELGKARSFEAIYCRLQPYLEQDFRADPSAWQA